LATISLAVDSIKHPTTRQQPEQLDALADIIMQENQRMNDQVERVLQVARLDRQETELILESADLNELVTEVLEQMQLQFKENAAEVVVDLHSEAMQIKVDPLHLKNAIRNLLDNAVKYSKDAPRIKVSTLIVDKQAVLLIEDEGIGMSEEQQARAFDQFYRVTSGDLHDTKGFGLGLYYVHHIVSLHHGSVQIESKLAKGTQVQIQLPIT
jgi:two-component system phosphate regulon sensor histidine kinase PhoR